MQILIDCDGVLADFLGGLLAAINREQKQDFKPADCHSWDISKAYGISDSTIADIVERSGFCAGLVPLPGASAAVEQMRRKHEVFCVTSPWNSPNWMHERTVWLKRHFGIEHKNVIHCARKELVFGDVLIDDKLLTVVTWAATWPNSLAVVWNQPYNQTPPDIELPDNVKRCFSWDEIGNLVDGCTHG